MIYMDFLTRIMLSLILGFIIGLERQLTGHPAGIRINVLIALGTSFFTLFPMLYGSDEMFRVAANIVTGVGFLCSGVIFKEGGNVKGINTAATLWCTTAIGILASTGMHYMAITATAVLVVSNIIFRPLVRKLIPLTEIMDTEQVYQISITCQENAERDIRLWLLKNTSNKNLYLTYLESGDAVGNKVEIIAKYGAFGKIKKSSMEEIVSSLLANPSIVSAGWEIA